MSKRTVALLSLLSIAAILSTGCATILSGTSQTITIDSYPPGAQVKVGGQTGTTPVTLRIPKKKGYVVEISRYADRRVVELERSIDPATFLNFIPPLWPGFIVDAIAGTMTHYDPAIIVVDFTQEPATNAQVVTYRP